MPQFMLFLHERASAGGDHSAEEIQAIIEKYRAWSQTMGQAGKLAGGDKLTNDNGRRMRRDGNGAVVTDAPFAEAKEAIGGFFRVEAADYDEACEIAGSCPHLDYGWIEVRQVDEV